METRRRQNPDSREEGPSRGLLILMASCLVITLVAFFLPPGRPAPEFRPATSHRQQNDRHDPGPNRATSIDHRPGSTPAAAPASAEEMVARRAARFAHDRHDTLHAMARKKNVSVPADVERFFEAAERGSWNEIEPLFNALFAEYKTRPHRLELDQLWAPIFDTFGALEEVHKWPAQKYLDYGNAILDSLRPGMVYVGGTDPGRFIPELLSETGEGESHVVITQNGLAAPSYLDYLEFLYGDRMSVPSPAEFETARDNYMADYQKRLAHDRQFPDEPKQILPGEDVTFDSDGSLLRSSEIATMAINERLLQWILQKNPEAGFALEESFPLKSTYAKAATLGPIMELRADDQNTLTPETAAQALDWWENTAQRLLSDQEATSATWTMMTYSKMADAQANLFAAHGLNEQAEQAYRLAIQLNPTIPEGVFGYIELLTGQHRMQDALVVAQAAAQADPGNAQFQNLVGQLQKSSGPTAAK